ELSQQVFEIGLRRASTLRNRSCLFSGCASGLGIAANTLGQCAKFLSRVPQFFVQITLSLISCPPALVGCTHRLLRLAFLFCLRPQLFTADSQLLRHLRFFVRTTTGGFVVCGQRRGLLSSHGDS